MALLAVAAEEKGIDPAVDGGPPVTARGDRLRPGQFLVNLLSNAIKFTPKGGQVRAGVSRDSGSCLIEVSGTGIPPARAGAPVRAFLPHPHGDRAGHQRCPAGPGHLSPSPGL